MKRAYAISFLLALLLVLAVKAQRPAAPIALTADEVREAATARQAVESAQAGVQSAYDAAIAVDLKDCAKVTAALGELKLSDARVGTARLQERLILDKQRAAHACAGCEWDGERKALIRPAAK